MRSDAALPWTLPIRQQQHPSCNFLTATQGSKRATHPVNRLPTPHPPAPEQPRKWHTHNPIISSHCTAILRPTPKKQTMQSALKKLLAFVMFFTIFASSFAQEASADRIIENGFQVLGAIDSGRAAELWEEASPTVKARIPKAEWARSMADARQKVGAVAERTWASVVRIRYIEDTPSMPAGLYANVDYSTRLRDGRTVFELLSFRQEADGTWRVTGYIPRQTQ